MTQYTNINQYRNISENTYTSREPLNSYLYSNCKAPEQRYTVSPTGCSGNHRHTRNQSNGNPPTLLTLRISKTPARLRWTMLPGRRSNHCRHQPGISPLLFAGRASTAAHTIQRYPPCVLVRGRAVVEMKCRRCTRASSSTPVRLQSPGSFRRRGAMNSCFTTSCSEAGRSGG